MPSPPSLNDGNRTVDRDTTQRPSGPAPVAARRVERMLRRTRTVVVTGMACAALAALVGAAPTTVVAAPGSATEAGPLIGFTSEAVHFATADRVSSLRSFPVSISAPETAASGTSFKVDGKAKSEKKTRSALLEERKSGSWVKIAQDATTKSGKYTFEVQAGSGGVRVLRVRAPKKGGLSEIKSATVKVRVRSDTATEPPRVPNDPPQSPTSPPTAPTTAPGSANDWGFLHDGGSRWNPCKAITWAYHPDGAYAGAQADIDEAIARVSAQSGLSFTYTGTTTYVPLAKPSTGTAPQVDLVVAWSDESQVTELAGSVAGVGGGSAVGVIGRDVAYEIVGGVLVLDRGAGLRPGFDVSGSPTWGQVITHEVMHVVGLHHAQENTQIMYPMVTSTNHRFGAGDLTGLSKVGASSGCLPTRS